MKAKSTDQLKGMTLGDATAQDIQLELIRRRPSQGRGGLYNQAMRTAGQSRKGHSMSEPQIVDRGDGPKIEGTRITIYTVLEYLRHGRSRDWIAAFFRLSSRQVQAAMDYIRDHESDVNAEYERIMERTAAGNPPDVVAKLQASHEKMKAKLARLKTPNA